MLPMIYCSTAISVHLSDTALLSIDIFTVCIYIFFYLRGSHESLKNKNIINTRNKSFYTLFLVHWVCFNNMDIMICLINLLVKSNALRLGFTKLCGPGQAHINCGI